MSFICLPILHILYANVNMTQCVYHAVCVKYASMEKQYTQKGIHTLTIVHSMKMHRKVKGLHVVKCIPENYNGAWLSVFGFIPF